MSKKQKWLEVHALTPERMEIARVALDEIREGKPVLKALRSHPLPRGGYLGKHMLVAVYKQMVANGEMQADARFLEKIRRKPMRTLSGVTTVTVLTKPYPCPGKCIFCPTDVRMPKSYLPDEPGAMRGLEHKFDPYDQVISRLEALDAIGHPIDKIELLILGGTWSSYKRDYQEWFVKRCFEGMNGTNVAISEGDDQKLSEAHTLNETTAHRNVGLVIETRPDEINLDEIRWLRYLGVTKVQIGAQSFDDHILDINKRGHDVETTRQAVSLLRAAGFKIVLHWMPNLLGATPDSDRVDFTRLWDGFCPDELKIYPNQLLANAELYEYWQRGEFHPYTTQELIDLITDIKPDIPRYCRVNRVIRDIPSTNVVEGNKRTSLRQDIQREMQARGTVCVCVRCREVRGEPISPDTLSLVDLTYTAGAAEEHFISYVTPDDKLAGFIRLSLPSAESPDTQFDDLNNPKGTRGAALIREVHVYGQALAVGAEKDGAAQHSGLGTQLLKEAEKTAKEHGFPKIAVISSVGTRKYYLDRGYERGEYYLVKVL